MNFKDIYSIDVTANVSTKGRFKYLSWAHAWKWFVEQYPTATYTVLKDDNNNCYFGNKEMGYMVYTSVTVEEITHEMWLPVMDHNNKAIKNPDMMAINKAVMRCLVKNLAMFGLGLYIYAGEDLPNEEDTPDAPDKPKKTYVKKEDNKQQSFNNQQGTQSVCADCGADVAENVVQFSQQKYGKVVCFSCQKNHNG